MLHTGENISQLNLLSLNSFCVKDNFSILNARLLFTLNYN